MKSVSQKLGLLHSSEDLDISGRKFKYCAAMTLIFCTKWVLIEFNNWCKVGVDISNNFWKIQNLTFCLFKVVHCCPELPSGLQKISKTWGLYQSVTWCLGYKFLKKWKKFNAGIFLKAQLVVLPYKENSPFRGVITKGSTFESDWTLKNTLKSLSVHPF